MRMGMGNGEWEMGNGEWGMGNGDVICGIVLGLRLTISVDHFQYTKPYFK
jgi:hypothetical protein